MGLVGQVADEGARKRKKRAREEAGESKSISPTLNGTSQLLI